MIRVLIADDEMLIRVGIKSILDSSDKYECIGGAANGKQALELAESEKPDIIITDIKMPEMDGIELIRGLKEKDCRSGIVILSNYNDFDLVREALKLGADDYLLKLQMTSDSLLKVLDEVCKKRNKDRGQILRQSKSVKLLLSDVLSQTFEMSESMEFFENQAEKGGALLTCLCLEICNPNSELSDHAVEDITENMWNELFAAWCTRIGEREYAIVVFGSYREKEGFMKALRCEGERYLNVLDDLLNITGRLYIGSVEEKPRRCV